MTVADQASATEATQGVVEELYARFATRDLDGVFALLADDFVSHNPRIAHDPSACTARQAFVDFFATPAGHALAGASQQVQRLVVQGELAAAHVRLSGPGVPEAAIVDLLRVRDGLVVEHWDVVQAVPSALPHPHGMF